MDAQEKRTKHRSVLLFFLAIVLGGISVAIAQALLKSINFFTNVFYYQRLSFEEASPVGHHLGILAVFAPVLGGLIVGLMARYGSQAIRGHGIPEAMENILLKDSKIPKRITWLKPLSAAVSIGSGGPFGAEGPIIATGGALGSLFGQILPVASGERKVLLAAGAAAGMTAIFGTPLAAVLLAIELLLFEFSAETFIPVAVAACTSQFVRASFFSSAPFLSIPALSTPALPMMGIYIALGVVFGLLSILVTNSVYWIEDSFEHLPVHWMFWPALGGIAVGIIGLISPHTLGVGYDNITGMLTGSFTVEAATALLFFKFLSWAIALGSGTSGGTLAPILTIGSGTGFLIASLIHLWFPGIPLNPTMIALAGMAALFAGCSRATLASVVFAFEMTQEKSCIVPVLLTCGIAHLVSMRFLKNSIMTEKIVRRGTVVPSNYFPESLLNSK